MSYNISLSLVILIDLRMCLEIKKSVSKDPVALKSKARPMVYHIRHGASCDISNL